MFHQWERRLAAAATDRVVRPFEWGMDWLHGTSHAEGNDADRLERWAAAMLAESDRFYALDPCTEYDLRGDVLTFPSAVDTPHPENNTVHARFFPSESPKGRRRAVLVLPQWNADTQGHVGLCQLLNRFGLTALRLTLPYHEARRPAGFERAEYMVSPNVGRTLQSLRQAVIDTRAAVAWLDSEGYERIGAMGTSIGSCTAFLAFVHDERIDAGVFNHVSGYVADVVWRGISTQHVRAGVEGALTVEELREAWLPISPMSYVGRLASLRRRPMRFIAARHDLTFPADLSHEVIAGVRATGVPVNVSWLPCGHYTSGERPWVYLDAWKIVGFLRKNL